MAVNDKIKFADYNDIRNKVIGILGTGSGNSGYGQPIRSSALSASTKVGVNDWANLFYDIYNAYYHQIGSAPSVGSIVENEIVRYAADKPNFEYNSVADGIVSDKFQIASSQRATATSGSGSQTWPGVYGTNWSSLAQCTITINFTTADQARYFFNSGGQLRLTSSRSGGAATSQNTSWTNLLNTVSSINGGTGPTFGGDTPNTGTEPNDGTNYYRLSSDWQSWYTATASSPYGSNFFRIFSRSPNVADNSNGTASEIQFLIYWVDGYTDPVPQPVAPDGYTPPASEFPPGDVVDGTLTIAISRLYATGTLVPAGSGAFVVETPSVTISAISS